MCIFAYNNRKYSSPSLSCIVINKVFSKSQESQQDIYVSKCVFFTDLLRETSCRDINNLYLNVGFLALFFHISYSSNYHQCLVWDRTDRINTAETDQGFIAV